MRFPLFRTIAVLALAVGLSGCYASKSYKEYRDEYDSMSYPRRFLVTWGDWFSDASDLVSAEISVGEGIGAYVQPTKLLTLGVLFEDVAKCGYRQRGFGVYREVRSEFGFSALYYRNLRLEPITGTYGLMQRPKSLRDFTIRHNSDRHWLDIGAEGHFLILGGSAFVSPWEAIDFVGTTVQLPYNLFFRPVFNVFGVRPPEIDVANDDYAARLRAEHNLVIINEYETFPPAEVVNQLFKTPY